LLSVHHFGLYADLDGSIGNRGSNAGTRSGTTPIPAELEKIDCPANEHQTQYNEQPGKSTLAAFLFFILFHKTLIIKNG
jgi:hypothetical protein